MTLSAVFSVDRVPCLISDYLVTGGTGRPITIPTYEKAGSLLQAHGVLPTGLMRKAALIPPSLLVAGSGNGESARRVIDRLSVLFLGRKLTQSVLRATLETIDNIPDHCSLIGWIVTKPQPTSFCWDSRRPAKLRLGGPFTEGSGRRMFQDLVAGIANSRLRREARFGGAVEACLHQTGTLWANEVLLGNTLVDRFGAGFDIFVYDGDQFQLVSDVTYLLFGLEYRESGDNSLTYRVWTLPLLTKASYVSQHCLLRVIIPPNRFGIDRSEAERIGFVPPIVQAASQKWPDTDFRDMPFTSERYVCCFFGRSVTGDREVFTAVASGSDAAQFKIYTRQSTEDGLTEIKFEFPDQIMKNMVSAAVQSLERKGARFPKAG